MRHPPQTAQPTEVLEWNEGQTRRVLDEVAVEEPLELRVGGTPVGVTMRTPGNDFDLAAGLLFTEGIVSSRDEVARMAYAPGPDGTPSGNLVDVTLTSNQPADLARLARVTAASSSCGICGKASIETVRARGLEPLPRDFAIDPRRLIALPDVLRSTQRVFARTGGIHAAALFGHDGDLIAVREDVGRHNAVDKIVGYALAAGLMPLSAHILLVSGRGGFEIVQKAIVARVPIVACVSAPSSLAVALAREYRQTLVGFLRGARFVVYAGEERLVGR